MGLMAIEDLTFDQSRRDGYRRGNQPPRRTKSTTPAQPEPQPSLISRRDFLRIGSGVIGTVAGLFIADRLGLLGFLHPESDQRKNGRLLENLQFSPGTKMEKDQVYRVGKVSLQQSTASYELSFNPQQFQSILNQCGINGIPENFQIIIAEHYASLNDRGQPVEQEAEISANGSTITLFIGLTTLFKNAAKNFDQNFQVTPEKRVQAEANFNILTLNQTLIRASCGGAIASDLARKNASRQEADQAVNLANFTADNFSNDLLNGLTQPALIVSQKNNLTHIN